MKVKVRNSPGVRHHLKTMEGLVQFKYKSGTFASWNDAYAEIHGVWLVLFKNQGDQERLGALRMCASTYLPGLDDPKILRNYQRRFEIGATGGTLEPLFWSFRVKSKSDRDQWIDALGHNLHAIKNHSLMDVIHGYDDLCSIADMLEQNLHLTSKKVNRRMIPNLFSGAHAMDILIARGFASNIQAAAVIGQRLMDADIIHHTTLSRQFGPGHYNFTKRSDYRHFLPLILEKSFDQRKFWRLIMKESRSPSSQSPTSSLLYNHHNGTPSPVHSTASLENEMKTPQIRNLVLSRQRSNSDVGAKTTTPERHQSMAHPPRSSSSTRSSSAPPPLVLMHPDEWQEPEHARECNVCNKTFKSLRRKHSCRACGEVICKSCSETLRVDVVGRSDPQNVRLCHPCQGDRRPKRQNHGGSSSLGSGAGSPQRQPSTPPLAKKERAPRKCSFCPDQACGPKTHHKDLSYALTSVPNQPWARAPLPRNEQDRLALVQRLRLSGNVATPLTEIHRDTLERVVDMASIASNCANVAIKCLGSDRVLVLASKGKLSSVSVDERRQDALANFVLLEKNQKPIVCHDAPRDVRFQGHPHVVKHAVRFYAAWPLELMPGLIVGALEVSDTRTFTGSCGNVANQMKGVASLVVKTLTERLVLVPQQQQEVERPVQQQQDSRPRLESLRTPPSSPEPSPRKMRPQLQKQLQTSTFSSTYDEDEDSLCTPGSSRNPSIDPQGSDYDYDAHQRAPPSSDEVLMLAPTDPAQSESMEQQLLELLTKTTTTQSQLSDQQGNMHSVIAGHSDQISKLASHLQKIEAHIDLL